MISLTITVLFIIILSALISLGEAAILSLNKNKFYIYKKDNPDKLSANLLEKILNDKSQYISSIVILSTFFNVGGSVIIGTMTSDQFKNIKDLSIMIMDFNILIKANYIFAFFFTIFILYFSKMIPKLIGAQKPLKTSLLMAIPIYYSNVCIKPFSLISQKICEPFIKKKEDTSVSMLDIKYLLNQAVKNNIIENREYEIINNSLLLNHKKVKDLVKTNYIETFSATESIKENIDLIKEFKHSRIIVTIGEKNDIPSGVVLVSELIKSYINNEDKKFGDLAHKLLIINENATLSHVLDVFGNSLDHLALVENDSKEIVGVLVIEDILDSLTNGFDY